MFLPPRCASPLLISGLLFAHVTIQEGHNLGAGAVSVGAELVVASAAGHAVLNGPGHCVGVIGVGSHIGEGAGRFSGGSILGTMQEGDGLRTGAGGVGREGSGGGAAGDLRLRRPQDCVIEVVAFLHIGEGIGLLDLCKDGLHGDLGGGHGEGVLAVLLGELHLVAVLVGDLDGIHLVALVRFHSDGHGLAAGGVLGADAHGAVLSVCSGDGVGGNATAAGGDTVQDDGAGQLVVVVGVSGGVSPAVAGVRRDNGSGLSIPLNLTASGGDGADGQRGIRQSLAGGVDGGVQNKSDLC